MAHPNWDKPFKLYTDASDTGLGAILTQDDDNGKERVIAYEARTLNQNEQNYPTTEKECLAVVWAVEKFRHYLGGWKKFKIFTDHAVLRTLMNHENPTGRRYRWMEKLTEYNFDIEYRPGKKMEQADCLSRMSNIEVEANDKQYRTDATYVLIVTYDKEGIWMSERYKALMKGKLQTSYGKVEEGETSWMAAVRELEEETGIKGPTIEYWGTDK